jgi:nondiscriminating glutamyl-tRNA synthetase
MVRGTVTWDAEHLGDFVIIKSDGWPVYNFAVVVDDLLMKITHVIRGDGHLPNTPRQLLIYQALSPLDNSCRDKIMRPISNGLKTDHRPQTTDDRPQTTDHRPSSVVRRPFVDIPSFAHLSTILGPDGTKLSKRHGAPSITELREQGYLPEALFNFLALLGWTPQAGSEVLSRQQLIEQFSLDRVGRAPALFDPEKLNWMNRAYLKSAEPNRLVELAAKYLRQAGRIGSEDEPMRAWLALVVDVVLSHLDHLSQIVRETEIIFQYDLDAAMELDEVREVLQDPGALEVLRVLDEELGVDHGPQTTDHGPQTTDHGPQTTDDGPSSMVHGPSSIEPSSIGLEMFQSAVNAAKQRTGRKGKALFHPIRVALTARASGPELVKLVPIYEQGSQLDLPHPMLSVRDRLKAFLNQSALFETE